MASETGSGLVFFIAAVALAGLAAGGMAKVVGSMAVELGERGETLAQAVGTDIAIVNDPDNVPYDDASDELTIYVKNTGTERLVSDELSILVDGRHRSFTSTLLDGADRWSRGVVLEATVSVSLATGDHSVRVVYTPSISDDLEFRV